VTTRRYNQNGFAEVIEQRHDLEPDEGEHPGRMVGLIFGAVIIFYTGVCLWLFALAAKMLAGG